MGRTRNTVETVFIGKDETSDDIRRIQRELTTLRTQAKKAGSVITGALGIGGGAFAVQQLAGSFNDLLQNMDEIGKMSAQLGTSTEWLSEMQFGAKLANIEAREFNIALQRMGRRAAQAAEGTGEAVDAFAKLGIELKVGDRLSTIEELLPQIADGMSMVSDQTERLALAQKIFDSEGVKMIRILDEGATGLDRMRESAQDAGATLAGETAANIARFNDEVEKMKANWRGVILTLVDLQENPAFKTISRIVETMTISGPAALGARMAGAGDTRLRDTTTPTGGAVGFAPYGAEAEKAFPTPEQISDNTLEYEMLNESLQAIQGTYSELAIATAEWGELGGRSIRLISQDVDGLGFTALGTGEMIVQAAEEGRDSLEQMIPVLDMLIDRLVVAGEESNVLASSLKGAAVGFITGGPVGAVVGAATPIISQIGEGRG
jgi:hypothetical protein